VQKKRDRGEKGGEPEKEKTIALDKCEKPVRRGSKRLEKKGKKERRKEVGRGAREKGERRQGQCGAVGPNNVRIKKLAKKRVLHPPGTKKGTTREKGMAGEELLTKGGGEGGFHPRLERQTGDALILGGD